MQMVCSKIKVMGIFILIGFLQKKRLKQQLFFWLMQLLFTTDMDVTIFFTAEQWLCDTCYINSAVSKNLKQGYCHFCPGF